MPNDEEPGASDARIATHQRISAILRAEIEQGVHAPGTRLPAEIALAQRFGVSRGTMRQALQTLRREGLVDAIPGRGYFVAHGSPSSSALRRKVVGVVVPSVAQPFVPHLLGWIEDELHSGGYSMMVGSSGWTREQQAGRIHRILAEGVSGLIAYPVDYDPDATLFNHLVERELPVVLIDRYIVGVPIDAVQPDNVGGAYAAVEHLTGLGHRRIAFVTSDNLSTTSVAERLQGYEQALRAAGVEPTAELIFAGIPVHRRWPSGVSSETTPDVAAIARFLEATRPTAVFALHEVLAQDVIAAAESLGHSLPEDLALVSFDDEAPGVSSALSLTIAAQPLESLGRTAARMLIERIEGRRTETARIVLPTTLIVRESSGIALSPPSSAAS